MRICENTKVSTKLQKTKNKKHPVIDKWKINRNTVYFYCHHKSEHFNDVFLFKFLDEGHKPDAIKYVPSCIFKTTKKVQRVSSALQAHEKG